IEDECHRPRHGVGGLGDECRVEDLRRALAALVEQEKRTGGRRIGEPARWQIDAVLGYRVGRQQRQHTWGILVVALLLALRSTLPRILARMIAVIVATTAILRADARRGESENKRDQKRTRQGGHHCTGELHQSGDW